MNETDLKQKIYEFARGYQLMALATTGGEHPWIANLYYAMDTDLTIYFLTNVKTIHSLHINTVSKVACAIFDSTQTPRFQEKFTKACVQLWGEA